MRQTHLHFEVMTMKLPRLVVLAGIVALAGVALHQARSADEPEKKSPPAPATDTNFAVRYAEAHLLVAELTLKKAQDMNRQVPQTLARGIIDQFSDDVEFAKAQLEDAKNTGAIDAFGLWLRRAELALKMREERLNTAMEANRRVPGAYRPVDLDRMRAAIEMARLRVERGRALADAPHIAKLDWQLEMINEGLNRVEEMVSLSIQNRLAEFF